jgi:hypothetical protein
VTDDGACDGREVDNDANVAETTSEDDVVDDGDLTVVSFAAPCAVGIEDKPTPAAEP